MFFHSSSGCKGNNTAISLIRKISYCNNKFCNKIGNLPHTQVATSDVDPEGSDQQNHVEIKRNAKFFTQPALPADQGELERQEEDDEEEEEEEEEVEKEDEEEEERGEEKGERKERRKEKEAMENPSTYKKR